MFLKAGNVVGGDSRTRSWAEKRGAWGSIRRTPSAEWLLLRPFARLRQQREMVLDNIFLHSMQTPYLLSSALSPAHNALVHRLENATSAAEVDAVCRAELDRIQHRLDKGKGKVKEVRRTLAARLTALRGLTVASLSAYIRPRYRRP